MPNTDDKKKILVFTKNWLGDVIFESPAIRAIKENFPSSELVCVAPERCKGILANYPYVDRVMTFDEKAAERPIFERLKRAYEFRRERFTHAFVFHRSMSRALLTWLAGIPYRAGYPTKGRARLLTHTTHEPPAGLHDTDYYLHLVRSVGLTASLGAPYEFYFSEIDSRVAAGLLAGLGLETKRFLAFHTGANWEPKRWPAERFLELIRVIGLKKDIPVLLVGGEADRERSEWRLAQARAEGLRVKSLAGETTLGELGAVFASARAVVSNDSGPLHIAGGVGADVVALFGPTNEVKTGPRGRGRHVLVKRERMSDISPADVLEALRELNAL